MIHNLNSLNTLYFQADASNTSVTKSGKPDGRANNGQNLTQADRSKGGRIAHQRGTAHEFTPEEARAAGRKGGQNSHKKRSQAQAQE